MANLQLNHIYKVYPNGVKAVNDFSMDIADKEFIVFVGPSGCGKSTTLRMIAGLEEISAGELKIGGVVVNDMEPKDRDIAMVFQNYALYPHMTVYDNMAFALRQRKTPKDEIDRRVKEAAEILGISDYLDRKPKAMSGGQRQRVALGRAIVREPKVFLLDEPLSNLDAKLRTTMRAEISKLHHRLQTTFIYVTHDQIEAMTMGTRIVVMKDGFVQQIDTPRNLYNFPTNKFVAGFIGTPQMNFYEGTALKEGAKVKIKLEGTDIEWSVPYKKFVKADSAFLNGEKPLIFGIRCEHVSMDPKKYAYRAECIVTNVEELGNDSQVYADFNTSEESLISENSKTKIIIKAAAGCGYEIGDKAEISFDLDYLNVFDAETENTIMPRIPQSVNLPVTVADGQLSYLGSKEILPPAMNLTDGEYTAQIPTDAIYLNGNVPAEVVEEEDVNGTRLLHLKAGNSYLFMAADKDAEIGKEVKIGFDLKKVTFVKDGQVALLPLAQKNLLSGYIRKTKLSKKDSQGNKYAFSLEIEGVPFNCSRETATRIISGGGQDVFKRPLAFEFASGDVHYAYTGLNVVNNGELDYGAEKYDKLTCGGKDIVIKVEDGEAKTDFVSLDMDKVIVWDTQSNIRLS